MTNGNPSGSGDGGIGTGSGGGAGRDGQTGGATGGAAAVVPLNHRTTPSSCAANPAPNVPACVASGVIGVAFSTCATDSACTTGRNGRCFAVGNAPTSDVSCKCTFDECDADDNCADGGTCSCGSANGRGNTCLPGNCRVDGDCGGGAYCSPTRSRTEVFQNANASTAWIGYYCHTPGDSCVNDQDCMQTGTRWGAHCAYEVSMGRWTCASYWTY